MVMDILKQELETGVHALSIQVIADSVNLKLAHSKVLMDLQ